MLLTSRLLDDKVISKLGFMESHKLLALLKTALKSLSMDDSTRLYFEFAPDNQALMKISVDSLAEKGDEIIVHLKPEYAACKPFLRALSSNTSNGVSGANRCC